MTGVECNSVPVPGVGALCEIHEPDATELRTQLAILTQQSNFPGPNPVSIDRTDFPKLREQPYFLAEKTDGVRFAFMVVRYKGLKMCVLFDRKLTPYVFKIQGCPRALSQGSVFDGELVRDKESGHFVYLIFDTVVACGVPVFMSSFEDRLEIAKKALFFYTWTDTDTAKIEIKEFVPASQKYTFEAHCKNRKRRFAADGVVMMPALDPVIIGKHDRLFKLKTDHTIDALAQKGKLYVYDEKTKRNKLIGVPVGPGAHLAADGAIVECRLAPDTGPKNDKWIVVNRRTDKAVSNNRFTFEKTLLNIRENLSLEQIPL